MAWAFAWLASVPRSFWRSISDQMDALMQASEEELQEVNEIGPRVGSSVREFFDEPKNVALVNRLSAARDSR